VSADEGAGRAFQAQAANTGPEPEAGEAATGDAALRPAAADPPEPEGDAPAGGALVLGGLRLSISTLTILPAGAPRANRRTAGAAMAFAPMVGLAIGASAAGAGQLAHWWTQSAFASAVVAVCALAVATGGLHLDGLADTADGLGSRRPADEALRLMKRPDIGPFGVAALVLVLAAQISSLTAAYAIHRGAVSVVVAAAAGRLAVTAACCRPTPAARPDGLGAWVAGTVRVGAAAAVGGVVLLASGALGLIIDRQTAALAAAAILSGLGGALALLYRCVVRFGGITGDVLGALVETGTTVALLIMAMRP
jgi:adenosylcobinamide-GDP ribazoletransferase